MRTTNALVTSLLCLVLTRVTIADGDKGKTADPLQGQWAMVRVFVNGTAISEEVMKNAGVVWTIKDNEIIAEQKGGTDKDKSTFELVTTSTPKRITIKPVDQTKGKLLHAIYEVNGDTLKIAYREIRNEETMPADFSEAAGFGVMTFQRVKS